MLSPSLSQDEADRRAPRKHGTRRESGMLSPELIKRPRNFQGLLMNARLHLTFLALVVATGSGSKANDLIPGPAQDSVTLKWQLRKDRPLFLEFSGTLHVTTIYEGRTAASDRRQTLLISFLPKEQDKRGNWLVIEKIEAIDCQTECDGKKLTYNSTKPLAPNPDELAKDLAPCVGAQFELTFGPDYKVLKARPGKNNPQIMPFPKPWWGPEPLTELVESTLLALHGKVLTKGMSWSRTQGFPGGQLGGSTITTQLTYSGREGRLLRFIVTGSSKYQKPTFKLPGLTIKSASSEIKNCLGVVLFDHDKGWIDSAKLSLSVESKGTIEDNGRTYDHRCSIAQTGKLRVTDTNPLKAPKWPK